MKNPKLSKLIRLTVALSVFSSVTNLHAQQRRAPRFHNMQTEQAAAVTPPGTAQVSTATPTAPAAKEVSIQVDGNRVTPIDVRSVQNSQIRQVREIPNQQSDSIEVTIAAGSEKKDWLNWAKDKWMASGKNKVGGKSVRVTIEGVGSIEAGNQIASGNHKFQVWAPASSAFRSIVESHLSGSAFASQDSLVQSPVVFALRNSVHEAIQKNPKFKDRKMNFTLMSEIFAYEENPNNPLIKSALKIDDTLKFGMTDPSRSNSGIVGLLVSSFEFYANSKDAGIAANVQRIRKLSTAQIEDRGLQAYIGFMKTYSDTTQTSTGLLASKLSREFELDAAFVYESDALKFLNPASQDPLRIIYPSYSAVCDHPFYTLKDGTSKDQQEAALAFLEFLKLPEQQIQAMKGWGFRPVHFPVNNEAEQRKMDKEIEANFSRYEKFGLVADLRKVSRVINPQDDSVIRGLIEIYKKVQFK